MNSYIPCKILAISELYKHLGVSDIGKVALFALVIGIEDFEKYSSHISDLSGISLEELKNTVYR